MSYRTANRLLEVSVKFLSAWNETHYHCSYLSVDYLITVPEDTYAASSVVWWLLAGEAWFTATPFYLGVSGDFAKIVLTVRRYRSAIGWGQQISEVMILQKVIVKGKTLRRGEESGQWMPL